MLPRKCRVIFVGKVVRIVELIFGNFYLEVNGEIYLLCHFYLEVYGEIYSLCRIIQGEVF